MGIVVAVAAALRVCFATEAQVVAPLRADAGQYASYARNLLDHGIYSLATTVPPAPDSFRSPGYPMVLALCRLLGGEGGWYALVLGLQCLLGTATVLLCYRLARSWLPFPAALAATVACALSPHLVASGAYVLTECVTTFVLVSGLLLLANATSRRRVIVAALTLGAAILCNETLVFLPIVLCWPLLRTRGIRIAACFLLLALTPFAGWTLRNATTDLARSGGERMTASISHGSYPGMVFRDPRLRGFPYHEDPEQPAFGASWHGLAEVLWRRVSAEPWRYFSWYVLEKPLWLWRWDMVQGRDVEIYEIANSPYERQPVVAATHWLMRFLHVPLMLLAAAAAAVLACNRRRHLPFIGQALGLVAVFGTLAYVPVIPDPRYLQSIRPVLFVLAAAAATVCVRWLLRHRGVSQATDPAASAVAATVETVPVVPAIAHPVEPPLGVGS